MQNRMPTGVCRSRQTLTARYMSTPQKKPRIKVAAGLCASLAEQTVKAVSPEAGTAKRTSSPQITVAMRFPSRHRSSSCTAGRAWFSGRKPTFPVKRA